MKLNLPTSLLMSFVSCLPGFAHAESSSRTFREDLPTVFVCNEVLGQEIVRIAGASLAIEKADPSELATRLLITDLGSESLSQVRVMAWRNELDPLTIQRLRNQGFLIELIPQPRGPSDHVADYLRLKILHDFLEEQFPEHAPGFEDRLTKEIRCLKQKARLRQIIDRLEHVAIDAKTFSAGPLP